jgi:antibiotic biosynthesis monooxygenase (ABM) superfamily enzyme
MLSSISNSSKRLVAMSSRRAFSDTVPINQVASVLKLNVGNEETALKMDAAFSQMNTAMKAHPGYERANRYVCKAEWAYEMSFIFKDLDSFKAWNTSAVRDEVHANYLKALEDVGIPEDKVYGGARVYDEWA